MFHGSNSRDAVIICNLLFIRLLKFLKKLTVQSNETKKIGTKFQNFRIIGLARSEKHTKSLDITIGILVREVNTLQNSVFYLYLCEY